MQNTPSGNIVRPVQTSNRNPMLIATAFVVVLGGLLVGWLISGKKTNTTNPSVQSSSTVSDSGKEAGAKDTSKFKDGPIGTLQVGGIKGEGTYHMDRPGGATQTVYLTSTVIDMAPFVGKKVQVWGETQASKYAPWFMDVVKIKVVD
jgi:hypothetical protein